MLLADIITQKIKEQGPISFHDYMEMALYYPGLGYYTADQDRIGKAGDFYTSSNLTHVFGAMVARQLEEMWVLLGRGAFTIVEYGAGTGALCHDILDYLRNNKELYDQLSYCIIEKSPAMRQKQKAHLFEKVSWLDDITEIAEITGCILSNELLDNLSVHQVVMEDELMEVFVDYDGEFKEVLQPAGSALKNYFEELDVVLERGHRTEVNLEATEWLQQTSSRVNRGYIITIDYGYTSDELYTERRSRGTLLCYNKHTINEDLYSNIGEQDITSHVNFTALSHYGLKYGLHSCGLTNQAGFLLALGFKEYLRNTFEPGEDLLSIARKEAFITRTLLINMGTKFKVLIQSKGTGHNELTGLRSI